MVLVVFCKNSMFLLRTHPKMCIIFKYKNPIIIDKNKKVTKFNKNDEKILKICM